MPERATPANEPKSARQRRRAPVIELKAEEIPVVEAPQEPLSTVEIAPQTTVANEQTTAATPTPEPAAQPSLAPAEQEPQPEAPPEPLFVPPPASPKPGMALPLAAAALVGALFGGVGGALAPRFIGDGPIPDATRLAEIERAQQDFAKQAPALANKTELDALKQSLTRLDADVAKRVADAAQPLTQKLAGLEGEVKAMAARPVQAASTPAQPLPPPIDLTPVQQRISSLEAQLKALDAKADAAAKVADPRLAALDQKMDQTSRRIEAGSAAPLFSATQALAQAFHRGAPFTNEMAAAELLGAKPEQLLPLKSLAEKGAPTAQVLATGFAPLAAKLTGSADQGGVTGLLQRFVSIRPTSESAGDTPPALVSVIEAALKRGDIPSALAAWGKLPEPARAASTAWGAQLAERDKAAKALVALQDAVTAGLRK